MCYLTGFVFEANYSVRLNRLRFRTQVRHCLVRYVDSYPAGTGRTVSFVESTQRFGMYTARRPDAEKLIRIFDSFDCFLTPET